ncbi:hypothetical protein [Actinoplanes sp. CA-252034]|uniref:hypothetical protein n=1 Tax=Actinoplanes sp. CA-252034 TaxID=3239906 RepID=UPI003D974C7C
MTRLLPRRPTPAAGRPTPAAGRPTPIAGRPTPVGRRSAPAGGGSALAGLCFAGARLRFVLEGRRLLRVGGRAVRLLSLLVVVAGALAVTGGPAAAHAGGLTATDARGRVVAVTPAVPGLEITAIEDGARLRLRNGTSGPVTIKPGGGTPTPAVIPPGGELTWIDERATPDGRSIAAGETVPWTIPLDVGGTDVAVTGTLIGEQRPPAALWWAAAAVTGLLIVTAARRVRRADLLLAAAGAIAAAASVAHVIGSTLAVESAPPVGTFLSAAGINLLAWPLIAGGAVTAFRGRAAGVLAVCGGAALTAVFVLPDVTSFHRAVLPFEGPAVLERILVVLALGLGAGVAVAGAGVLRDLAQKATAAGDGAREQPPTAGAA